jgi:L-rhamnose mutarotase
MERVGFLLKVRKDRMDEYKKHHEAVWPDMLEALTRHGWHNYSLFLSEEGMLFGYFEAVENFQASLDGMATEDANARWQTFMAEYFEDLPGLPDEGMVQLEQVFYLE